ncbi:MAG: hypothetical protein ACRCX2_01115 [Paraclostridium sp.]
MISDSVDLRNWISLLDTKIRKHVFNRNVSIYKSIVYGFNYGEDNRQVNSGNVNGNDTINNTLLDSMYNDPRFKPYVSDINKYIDYWVSNLETTIWNYSQPAFELLPNQIGLENDPDLIKYYNNISQYLLDKFNDPVFNFKKSFNSFIRDWYEFGLGVIFIDKTPVGDVFVTVPPEYVSIEFGKTNTVERIVFSLKNTKKLEEFEEMLSAGFFDFSYSYTYSLQDEIYRIFEKDVHLNKWRSSQYIYNISTNKLIKVYENKYYDYQPVYISTYNPRSGNRIGDGVGLYILPTIMNINNMLRTLYETAYASLVPTIVIPDGQIDSQKQNMFNDEKLIQALGCKILTKSYNSISDQMPIQPLPINSNPNQTLYLMELYKKDIRDILAPNQMIMAKGESGMSIEETQMRDAYDRTSISNKAAAIVDDIVIPLIKYMARSNKSDFPMLLVEESLTEKKSFSKRSKEKTSNKFENIDIMNFRVRVRNVSGDQHLRERIIDMNSYMSIVERAMNLKQTGVNIEPILSEASKLFSISSDTEQSQILNLQSLMQTAGQVAKTNMNNNSTV